ncbi:MAG: ZIP family metal transporter [Clostridia bacterium]|nr:ZIP family metal transporter [Clostridia bacterium]
MEIIKITLVGLLFGTFGTTIGGIIGVSLKNISDRFLSFILSFAAGLMMAVVCFELIPEALAISKISTVILTIIAGIIIMIFCDYIVGKSSKMRSQNKLLKTGIVISIGLALHNVPEGLAIGSSFGASIKLGYALAIAIAFHDVPEGIAMAIPLKTGGMKSLKVIWYVILSGFATGIGAFAGAVVGSISQTVIAICLSFAAGAMLYIVSGELIPESNKIYRGTIPLIGNILGILVGLCVGRL